MRVPEASCIVCKQAFVRHTSMTQTVCSIRCAQRIPVINRRAEREAKSEHKRKLAALKTRGEWMEDAQRAFNAFIRARDAGQPCICCGRYSQGAGADRGGEWDAGHYRSRGAAPELRFDERNAHAQLKQCNRRAWDVAGYRANLIERIGLDATEGLESKHPPRKYTIDDLRAICATYRAKLKALEATA